MHIIHRIPTQGFEVFCLMLSKFIVANIFVAVVFALFRQSRLVIASLTTEPAGHSSLSFVVHIFSTKFRRIETVLLPITPC